MRAVEAESARLNLRQADAAPNAGELLGEYQLLVLLSRLVRLTQHLDHPIALSQGGLHRLSQAISLGLRSNCYPVNDQLNVMPLLFVQVQTVCFVDLEDFTVDPDSHKPGFAGSFKHLFVLTLFAPDFGRNQGNSAAFRQGQDGVDNLLDCLLFHRASALGAMRVPDPGEEQAQIVIYFGNGANGGSRVVGHPFLVDGYCRG